MHVDSSNDATSVINDDEDNFYDEDDIIDSKEEDEVEEDNLNDPDWKQTPMRKRRLVSCI